MTVRWPHVVAAAAVIAVAATLAVRAQQPAPPKLQHQVASTQVRPGVAADVFLPARRAGTVPLLVLVPGGSWLSADPTGLRPLADAFAAAGSMAVTTSYRVGSSTSRYPVPAQDIACAVGFAVQRAHTAGLTPSPVVLLGHSAGGQLAALVALGAVTAARDCPYPSVLPDAFVGLSGVYNVVLARNLAAPLFPPTGVTPDLWYAADPERQAARRPTVPVLLLHGTLDRDVSPRFSTSFAAALQKGGHRVRMVMVTGADHGSIYRPDVSAALIERWVATLSAA